MTNSSAVGSKTGFGPSASRHQRSSRCARYRDSAIGLQRWFRFHSTAHQTAGDGKLAGIIQSGGDCIARCQRDDFLALVHEHGGWGSPGVHRPAPARGPRKSSRGRALSLAVRIWIRIPRSRAASCASFRDIGTRKVWIVEHGNIGGFGTTSCNNASRFACRADAIQLMPVTLPPGRPRLATRPASIGSSPLRKTIRIAVFVAPGCLRRSTSAGRDDHRYLTANQLRRQPWQSVGLTLRPAVFDGHIPSLNVASLTQAPVKCGHKAGKWTRRSTTEESDHRHRRLLCARGERPCRRRTTEQRDELASFHARPQTSEGHRSD